VSGCGAGRGTRGPLCPGPLAEAGDVEYTQRAVRIVGEARQLQKVPGMGLQGAVFLVQTEEAYRWKVHNSQLLWSVDLSRGVVQGCRSAGRRSGRNPD